MENARATILRRTACLAGGDLRVRKKHSAALLTSLLWLVPHLNLILVLNMEMDAVPEFSQANNPVLTYKSRIEIEYR